jgi:hypothetical protein
MLRQLRRLWHDATKKPGWSLYQPGFRKRRSSPQLRMTYLTKSVRTKAATAAREEIRKKAAAPIMLFG